MEYSIEIKSVRVNVKKMEMVISGENAGSATDEGRFPCDVRRNVVGSNFILYQFCSCCVHKDIVVLQVD